MGYWKTLCSLFFTTVLFASYPREPFVRFEDHISDLVASFDEVSHNVKAVVSEPGCSDSKAAQQRYLLRLLAVTQRLDELARTARVHLVFGGLSPAKRKLLAHRLLRTKELLLPLARAARASQECSAGM